MFYFLALIPATALTVAGYFVLYFSARTEGGMRAFGKYLAFWSFTLAGLLILGAIFAAAHGHRMHGMRGMHGNWPRGPHFEFRGRPGFPPRGPVPPPGTGNPPTGPENPATSPSPEAPNRP
jgi:hypothetical protein